MISLHSERLAGERLDSANLCCSPTTRSPRVALRGTPVPFNNLHRNPRPPVTLSRPPSAGVQCVCVLKNTHTSARTHCVCVFPETWHPLPPPLIDTHTARELVSISLQLNILAATEMSPCQVLRFLFISITKKIGQDTLNHRLVSINIFEVLRASTW